MRNYLLTLIILVFSMTVINAQDITGAWKGALDVQGTKITLIFHLQNNGNGVTATMDSPDQGAAGIPVDSASFAENTLLLAIKAAGISYKGTLDKNTITGVLKQAGMELPLVLTKTVITKPGDTTLPSGEAALQKIIAQDKGNYQYRVEDYFARPKSSQFQLSPGGKFLSYMEKENDGKRHVYVKEIATGKITRAIEEKGYTAEDLDNLLNAES